MSALVTLTVSRVSGDKHLTWYFDLNSQALDSMRLCIDHDQPFVVGYTNSLPDDEYVTSADEFSNWFLGVEP